MLLSLFLFLLFIQQFIEFLSFLVSLHRLVNYDLCLRLSNDPNNEISGSCQRKTCASNDVRGPKNVL